MLEFFGLVGMIGIFGYLLIVLIGGMILGGIVMIISGIFCIIDDGGLSGTPVMLILFGIPLLILGIYLCT